MPRSNPIARKWYGTREWRELRQATLEREPVCTRCHHAPSTVVDHKTPHKGSRQLFFDPRNLTGLCKRCHDTWKARKENGHIDSACGEDGYPIDPEHPWN